MLDKIEAELQPRSIRKLPRDCMYRTMIQLLSWLHFTIIIVCHVFKFSIAETPAPYPIVCVANHTDLLGNSGTNLLLIHSPPQIPHPIKQDTDATPSLPAGLILITFTVCLTAQYSGVKGR